MSKAVVDLREIFTISSGGKARETVNLR